MTARNYMSPVVQNVSPRATLKEAAKILFEHDCGMVPVLDGDTVKGVITDRDVAIIACNRDRPLSELNVGEVVKDQVYSCGPDDDLGTVLGTMTEKQVRRLLVLSGGSLEGVISFDDLSRAVTAGKLDAAQFAQALSTISGQPQTAS